MSTFLEYLKQKYRRPTSSVAEDADWKNEDHPRTGKGHGGGQFRTSSSTIEKEDSHAESHAQSEGGYKIGQKIDVELNGRMYPAKVTAIHKHKFYPDSVPAVLYVRYEDDGTGGWVRGDTLKHLHKGDMPEDWRDYEMTECE